MKTLLSLKLWLAVCLLAVSTVSSAGILWESTQKDSDFVVPGFPYALGETFGIFSATEALTDDNATLITGFLSFKSAEPFRLALKLGTDNWITETGSTLLPGACDDFLLSFLKPGVVTNNIVHLIGIDIKEASESVTGVPLPASIWFMTSALLGLLYTGRRKDAVQA